MKRLFTILLAITVLVTLTGCQTESVVCGEGTVIQDGKCVAPDNNNDNQPDPEPELSCDSIPGDVFYEFDFNALSNDIVSNETGDLHTANNFVVWGSNESGLLKNNASVANGKLTITGLDGTQLDHYYDTGLGYQHFDFENDVTYTVCAIVSGPKNESMTSELGIYYGYGVKDEFLLTGESQMIIQSFKPTISTNTDKGQYVIFTGKISGDVTIEYIKITEVE